MTGATGRNTSTHQAGESRREALGKLGRFAGYTAPTMLVLLGSSAARARAIGSGGGPSRGKSKSRGRR